MEKFTPFEKLSKKKQRELNRAKRGSWYGINPVTRKPENSNAYNRRKAQKWSDSSDSVPFAILCCWNDGAVVHSSQGKASELQGANMIYTKLTKKAMELAYNAHHGQKDTNGVPYIYHSMHLAEQMEGETTTCIALLHDVVEDTEVTFDQLRAVFPDDVIEALELMTHTDSTSYIDYIKRIKTNPVAVKVKLADIAHNSDESRFADDETVREKELEYFRRKYQKALEILRGWHF